MQETMQFTAYLRGFTNTQPPRHLKGFLFLSKLSLISFPIEDGKLKKNGAKSTCQKSNLECWQNCLWFSIVFHCSFFGFSLVFCDFHWFFLDLFIYFSLVLNNVHVLFFAYHCFCSLVFIGFSCVFVWLSFFLFLFICFSTVPLVFVWLFFWIFFIVQLFFFGFSSVINGFSLLICGLFSCVFLCFSFVFESVSYASLVVTSFVFCF